MNSAKFALSAIICSLCFVAPANAQVKATVAGPLATRMAPGAAKAGPIVVAGKVLLPGGAAAPAVRVYVAVPGQDGKTHFQTGTTDSAGKFKLTATPDQVNSIGIGAVVPGKYFAWRSAGKTSPELRSLTLKLEPGITLTGKVVHLDASPASNLDVSVASLRPALRGVDEALETRGQPNEFFFMPGARMFPEAVIAQFKSKTSSDGRFSIAGLPRGSTVKLNIGGGLQLAPGSAGSVDLTVRDKQISAGVLAAMKPASLRITLVDHTTGKPVVSFPIGLTPIDFFTQAFQTGMDFDAITQTAPKTDASGKAIIKNLAPGDHRYIIQAAVRNVSIPDEGAMVDITAHTGTLTARILDPSGKPVPGATLDVDVTPDIRSQFPIGGFSQQVRGRGEEKSAKDGTFPIVDFPWDTQTVTIRARRGNDMAEWTGNPSTLGKGLDLTLKPGALITVTGKLVDTHRQPVGTQSASLIRWQDGPRISWFNSAEPVQVTAGGGFKIEGLRRGEGFSVISGSPFAMGGGQNSFESPRFTTASTGATQELGDVVVHPLEGPEQIIQIYGFDSRKQLAMLGSLRPQPDDIDVKQAMEALRSYSAAQHNGDIDAIQRATSSVSPGWSEDRKQFLLYGTLRPTVSAAAIDSARPLRFVAGISLSYLMLLNRLSHDPSAFFAFGAAAREVEANPNWVVAFSTVNDKPVLAGLLRKENGAWKVVNAGSGLPFQEADELFFFDRLFGRRDEAKANFKAAPQPDTASITEARSVAEKYMQAWSSGKDSVVLALTSPLSPNQAKDIESMREARSQRIDDGVCPIASGAAIRLEHMSDLSSWELGQLVRFSLVRNEFGGAHVRSSSSAESPDERIKRGDIVPFRYQADGREFYLLMARQNGKWTVLEPSIEQLHTTTRSGIADSR